MLLRTKVELGVAVVILAAATLFLNEYIHQRENAAAYKATAEAKQELVKQSNDTIAALRADFETRFAALEKQKQQVVIQPSQAPQVIHDYLPTSTPIQQTAAITKDTLPDAPVAILTKQNEIDLAQKGIACQQCAIENASLKGQMAEKDKIIVADTEQLKAANQALKGGTKMKRFVRAVEYIGIGAGIGYAAHR